MGEDLLRAGAGDGEITALLFGGHEPGDQGADEPEDGR